VNIYNVAMIEQKAAEMLFAIPPAKRSFKDLQRAVDQGAHSQKLFASLAQDKSGNVPYDRDIADQRRKYGESMLRKGDDHLATQQRYESEQEARLAGARLKRQEDKERITNMEREREEEIRKQAEVLAEERRKAREEAQKWTLALADDSEDEKERKPRKSRKIVKTEGGGGGASAAVSGDEGPGASEGKNLKKKKSQGRIKKEADGVDNIAVPKEEPGEGADEEAAIFSGEELDEKPVRKRAPKKRVVRDEDDEATSAAPRKKQFKSKETISDSDEEMS